MLWPLLFLFLFIPMLMASLFLNLAIFSFARLGLSPGGAMLLLSASVIGGLINIPVSRRRLYIEEPRFGSFPFFFYYPPQVSYQLLCINVGGAVIPVLFSLHLLATRAPLLPALTATLIVTVVAKLLARIVPGVGISIPTFIPPVVAALAAIIVSPHNAAPVAYIAGAIGTLLGADILNLGAIRRLQSQVVSIGGAGVFDGIFLVALAAALLS
ncbi:DUF1614 domain-containing protein [Neomoorella thermoacetica]|uniref:DUF1614 domain-containing protein n=3 Tax=Neomoorella thermoacetica TaxID=1525 RepID=A0A1D7XAT9_NEOTH|nr:DUF1614 domain-containing protein [Moorella thermoacetica]AKX94074.1 hypothetical protein MOTHE_c12810 [Moorella thermoacetica]AKX96713.1 hypothetical protein MOTHA_c13670 [Moorella thermoacetica]AOQ24025.1 hypothetical protein Maut_01586 [Moorella thermoacetica]APC08466.1 hypothetical protein MTJW_13070 [Moorella thermoacetica]OIQ09230.1 hypothetical protein MOOR_09880 [Moorella thermoacetica]